MNFLFSSTILLLQLVVLINGQKHFPEYFPRCYRDDPNVNKCLLEATRTAKPFLQKGIPEFKIAPLSPYKVSEVNLSQGTEALNYKNVISNLVIVGLDTYEFRQFDFDPKALMFRGAVDMGKISFTGDYAFEGKILSIPLAGKGKFFSNVTSSNGTLEQSAKLVTKKGVTYLIPDDPTIKIEVGEVSSNMEGLFDNNEELKRVAENVIKDNMRELVKEFTPAIEKVIEKIIQDLLLKSVSKVPYDELFPLKDKH